MHELADVLAIERYNLTRLVDRLEQEGLVTRARSADDGRAAYASITDKGRTLRKKMWKVYQSTVSELFLDQFGGKEQAAMAAALDRAAAAARRGSRREVASAGTHVSRSHSGASPARPSRPARGRRRPAAEARPRRSSVHSARARRRAGQIRAERREAGRDERPDLRGDVPA